MVRAMVAVLVVKMGSLKAQLKAVKMELKMVAMLGRKMAYLMVDTKDMQRVACLVVKLVVTLV